MKKIIKIVCAIVLIGVLLYIGYRVFFRSKSAAPQMQAPQVTVVDVSYKEIAPSLDFVAKIEPQDKVGLRARVTGFLEKRLFSEGDIVIQGEPLYIIEKDNFRSALKEAQANYEKAKARAVNAKAQYNRFMTLYRTKDVSAARLDEAKATYESAQAEIEQTEALVELAEKNLEYTEIVAPMDGKIGESKFSVGELVSPESGPLAEIVKINPIDAVFSISENQMISFQQEFMRLKPDEIIVHFIFSDNVPYALEGKFSFIDTGLDEAMNTLKLKASFPNPDGQLIPGQYGKVVLTGKNKISRLIIPLKAVQRDMQGAFVYLITPENKVEKRLIKTGSELEHFEVEVLDGLQPGDKIMVEGFQKVIPGATVQATTVKEK